MIKIRDLTKSYGDICVYKNFDMDIEEGRTCCILGDSGCGKTTLLNVLAGLTPYVGDVPKLRTSYVFQSPRLVPNLTVLGNLKLVGAWQEQALSMLAAVGLKGYEKRYPAGLSGGQAQRVALCRAFLFAADIMLLDEPFSSLDLKLKLSVMDVFKGLMAKNPVTAVAVTHDVDEALYLGDRIVVLKSGRIAADFKNAPSSRFGANSTLREEVLSVLLS